jgi:NADH:ubiquinone oxidoreductase subunit 5 (subunit L)/multisubunit Na+/H+ antiporter MnhA subunit
MLLAVITSLALIGGLATACFTKAFGIVFLGEPRTEHARHAHEVKAYMLVPEILLALGCIAIGLLSSLVVPQLQHVLSRVSGQGLSIVQEELQYASDILFSITLALGGLLALILVLSLVRKLLLMGRKVETAVTWDCGYVKPYARMEYTSSSFAQPLLRVFQMFVHTRKKFEPPQGLFPKTASFESETPDIARVGLFKPLFLGIDHILSWFRWLQHGRIHLYVLYIVITLLVLLVWGLR